MPKKLFIKYTLQFGIKTWLKVICKKINIIRLEIVTNSDIKGKIDKLFLEATNLIYREIYINKIKIKTNNFNINFNFENYTLYSNNMVIKCFLEIDSRSLEKIFCKDKWQDIRKTLENEFTEGNSILNFQINSDLINLYYQLNDIYLNNAVTLQAKDNQLLFKGIINKKEVLLPLDKSIKIKHCKIKNELINIELISKVNFDN